MQLLKIEQETIINYNQEEKMASCYTHDISLMRKLDSLCEKHKEITVVREDEDSKEYCFPKKWVKIKAPNEISEERKQELAERMRSLKQR